MSFVEWVGFVASLIGVVYLFTRDALAKREKAKDPVKYAEKERRLKEVLRQMGVEVEPEEEQKIEEEEEEEEDEVEKAEQLSPPPPPKPHAATSFPAIHVATTPGKIVLTESRVAKMIAKMPDKRALLISQVLFGPPKSLE